MKKHGQSLAIDGLHDGFAFEGVSSLDGGDHRLGKYILAGARPDLTESGKQFVLCLRSKELQAGVVRIQHDGEVDGLPHKTRMFGKIASKIDRSAFQQLIDSASYKGKIAFPNSHCGSLEQAPISRLTSIKIMVGTQALRDVAGSLQPSCWSIDLVAKCRRAMCDGFAAVPAAGTGRENSDNIECSECDGLSSNCIGTEHSNGGENCGQPYC